MTAPTAPRKNPPRNRKPNTARAAGRAGTPGGRAARRIVAHQLGTPVAIVYRHAHDGKLYRHSFSAKTAARLAHAQIGGPVLIVTNTRTTKRNGASFIA